MTGSVRHTSLQVRENNGSSVFVELLRGRDGLPGRDGVQGLPGPPDKDGNTGQQGPPGPPSSKGAIYTRWGKSSCPEVELVYSGITGGSMYNQEGGGANHLCMPKDPEYTLRNRGGLDGYVHVYGAEYDRPLQGTHDHNVPCAVCYVSTRPTVLMIPAKTSCPQNWIREYYGYIMTQWKGSHNHNWSCTMFECVDKDQESLPGI